MRDKTILHRDPARPGRWVVVKEKIQISFWEDLKNFEAVKTSNYTLVMCSGSSPKGGWVWVSGFKFFWGDFNLSSWMDFTKKIFISFWVLHDTSLNKSAFKNCWVKKFNEFKCIEVELLFNECLKKELTCKTGLWFLHVTQKYINAIVTT